MTTKYGVGQVYDGMVQIEFIMPNEDWANEVDEEFGNFDYLVLNRLYFGDEQFAIYMEQDNPLEYFYNDDGYAVWPIDCYDEKDDTKESAISSIVDALMEDGYFDKG